MNELLETTGMKCAVLSSSSTYNEKILFHECLWCTSAVGASWLSENTPFSTTENGFLKVKDSLECENHPGVFAAGDCCHMMNHPRPKGKGERERERNGGWDV